MGWLTDPLTPTASRRRDPPIAEESANCGSLIRPAWLAARGDNFAKKSNPRLQNLPYPSRTLLAEGRHHEASYGGAGRRRDRRTGPRIRQPAPGNSGPWLERRPRCRLATGTRAASGLRPGTQRSPARSWLTAAHDAAESAARCRKENAAAERREARRPASWAGHLRRSGDGPDREAGHGVRRFRTSACRRSAPLIFFGERKQTTGHPAPSEKTGRRSVGFMVLAREMKSAERAANSEVLPSPIARRRRA